MKQCCSNMVYRWFKRRFVVASKRIAVKAIIVVTVALCLLNLRHKNHYHHLRAVVEERRVEWKELVTMISEETKLEPRQPKRLNKVEEPNCMLDINANAEVIYKEPVITLDPSRFIMPVLVQGANNQLIGFRDSVYLAIILNRTLILPAFFRHRSDRIVNTNLRLNVNMISKILSVIPHEKWHDICPDFEDVYVTKHTVNASKMNYNETNGKIHILTSTASRKNVYPLTNADSSFNALKISDPSMLETMYASSGKCAMYLNPFRSIGIKENTASILRMQQTANDILKQKKYEFNADDLKPHDLYALIVHATPQPTYASNVAAQFLSRLSGRLLAVHWRYDKDDWLTRCYKIDKLSNKGKNYLLSLCEKLLKTTPLDVARGIHFFIKDLSTSHQPDSIYITTPLTMLNFTLLVKDHIRSLLPNVKVYFQNDLHKFVFSSYNSCDSVVDSYTEISSQVEMSICTQADIFLRSPMSSWSKIIQEKRIIEGSDVLDEGILDLSIRNL